MRTTISKSRAASDEITGVRNATQLLPFMLHPSPQVTSLSLANILPYTVQGSPYRTLVLDSDKGWLKVLASLARKSTDAVSLLFGYALSQRLICYVTDRLQDSLDSSGQSYRFDHRVCGARQSRWLCRMAAPSCSGQSMRGRFAIMHLTPQIAGHLVNSRGRSLHATIQSFSLGESVRSMSQGRRYSHKIPAQACRPFCERRLESECKLRLSGARLCKSVC